MKQAIKSIIENDESLKHQLIRKRWLTKASYKKEQHKMIISQT